MINGILLGYVNNYDRNRYLENFSKVAVDAKTVVTKLIEKFISVFGIPATLHSDQGSIFESTVFQEVCKLLGIEKTGRPQSDGMIERACRSVQCYLPISVKIKKIGPHIYPC